MNIEDKIPEIGKEYFYYKNHDEFEKWDCVITNIIEFEKIDALILKLWKFSIELYKDNYAQETDYFIFVNWYDKDRLIRNNSSESHYIFVKGIDGNWIELYNPNQILVLDENIIKEKIEKVFTVDVIKKAIEYGARIEKPLNTIDFNLELEKFLKNDNNTQ